MFSRIKKMRDLSQVWKQTLLFITLAEANTGGGLPFWNQVLSQTNQPAGYMGYLQNSKQNKTIKTHTATIKTHQFLK